MMTFILNPGEEVLCKLHGSMQFYEIEYSYPGTLFLTNERVVWKASGMLNGKEVDNEVALDLVSNVKKGWVILSHRIAIYFTNGDNWLINQVDKEEASQFVKLLKHKIGVAN